MIHDILPVDAEFARGLINAHHSDAEILSSLVSRGIEQAKAAQLVDDLRHGRQPNVQVPYGLETASRHANHRSRHDVAHAPQPPPSHQHGSHGRKHRHAGMPWWFVLLVLAFLLALGYALFEGGRTASGDAKLQEKHEIPAAPGK